jgi:hypothetical protein
MLHLPGCHNLRGGVSDFPGSAVPSGSESEEDWDEGELSESEGEDDKWAEEPVFSEPPDPYWVPSGSPKSEDKLELPSSSEDGDLREPRVRAMRQNGD